MFCEVILRQRSADGSDLYRIVSGITGYRIYRCRCTMRTADAVSGKIDGHVTGGACPTALLTLSIANGGVWQLGFLESRICQPNPNARPILRNSRALQNTRTKSGPIILGGIVPVLLLGNIDIDRCDTLIIYICFVLHRHL